MENLFKAAIICLSIFTSTCFADTLVLSAKLKIEYLSPQSIAHGSSNLIVKYKDWSFMHVVVDPKDIYQQIDLTGMEKDYIRSIFDEKARAKLPKWLAITAKEQADVFGVSPETTNIFMTGKAEVFSVYDQKDKKGQIFIIEDLSVHQIYTNGDKKHHDLIAKNIKER
jgi:hypothetical protein